jgi:hypothetical protein
MAGVTQERRNPSFPRMISDFVRLRAVAHLAPREVEQLRVYLLDVLAATDGYPQGIDAWRLPFRRAGLIGRVVPVHDGLTSAPRRQDQQGWKALGWTP